MAVPRKAKSRSIYRGGKKLQINPINTIHTAPQRTAGMQRRAPKAPVIIPFDVLNFPSLSGAIIIPVITGPQNNGARAADPLENTLSHSMVLQKAMGLPVPENSTTYMPREVAKGMQYNARRVMMTAAPVVVNKLEALPEELMDEMLQTAVPDRINLASPETVLVPGQLPSFMPSIIRLSKSTRQLKYIQAVLRKAVFEVKSLRDLNTMHNWLVSLDFTSLPHGLRNGFDAVRLLSFSDINRTASLMSNQRWPVPSTWANDLQLAQMCNDLRHVEVDVSLSDRFLLAIGNTHSMAEAMGMMEAMKKEGEDNSQTYQLTRFLELKGLEVLRLQFFTDGWNMTTLNDGKMRMITSWLEEEFKAREQSVKVEFFGWEE